MSRQRLFCTVEREENIQNSQTDTFLHFAWPSYFTKAGVHREVLGVLLYFLIIETFFPRDILKNEKGQVPCYEIYSFELNKHIKPRILRYGFGEGILQSFIRCYLLSITTYDSLLILSV